jgi:hypothetical protein
MVVLAFFVFIIALPLTGEASNIESRAPLNDVLDEDFLLQQIGATWSRTTNDSTTFVLRHSVSAADTELTMKYYSLGYNFLMPILASVETDSCAFNVVVRTGVYDPVSLSFIMVPVDSIQVTSSNQDDNPPQAISIPGGKIFDVLIRTVTGCSYSDATILRLWYRRYR